MLREVALLCDGNKIGEGHTTEEDVIGQLDRAVFDVAAHRLVRVPGDHQTLASLLSFAFREQSMMKDGRGAAREKDFYRIGTRCGIKLEPSEVPWTILSVRQWRHDGPSPAVVRRRPQSYLLNLPPFSLNM